MTPPTAAERVARAEAKLTAGELAALRAQLRRELRAELDAKPSRPPRERELPELVGAARRMVKAVAARCGADVEGLAELAQLRDVVDAHLADAVRELRSGAQLAGHDGYSWTDIARVLGCTRQAAQQRFSK